MATPRKKWNSSFEPHRLDRADVVNALLVVCPPAEGKDLRARLQGGWPDLSSRVVSKMPEAVKRLRGGQVRAVVCDLEIFAEFSAALRREQILAGELPVVLLVAPGSEDKAARAMEQGAAALLLKAGSYERLLPVLVEQVLQTRRTWEQLGRFIRHEINNPLTGILGNAELALDAGESLPVVTSKRLRTIIELTVRLRNLLRTLEGSPQQWFAGSSARPGEQSSSSLLRVPR